MLKPAAALLGCQISSREVDVLSATAKSRGVPKLTEEPPPGTNCPARRSSIAWTAEIWGPVFRAKSWSLSMRPHQSQNPFGLTGTAGFDGPGSVATTWG